jgi:hypothetical protein
MMMQSQQKVSVTNTSVLIEAQKHFVLLPFILCLWRVMKLATFMPRRSKALTHRTEKIMLQKCPNNRAEINQIVYMTCTQH